MIINGENLILGRLASYAAKKALLGEHVDIINCEKIAVTGKKDFLFERYKKKFDRGTFKGPLFHRNPAKIVRRTVRGMLPYKQERGKTAFSKVKCYIGIPSEFKGKDSQTIEKANILKLKNLHYVYMNNISKFLGGKI
jgi:large subunit ribosomal protein L13